MDDGEPRKVAPKNGCPNVRKTYRFSLAPMKATASSGRDASLVSKSKIVRALVAEQRTLMSTSFVSTGTSVIARNVGVDSLVSTTRTKQSACTIAANRIPGRATTLVIASTTARQNKYDPDLQTSLVSVTKVARTKQSPIKYDGPDRLDGVSSLVSLRKLARFQRPDLVSRKPTVPAGKMATRKQSAPISTTEFLQKHKPMNRRRVVMREVLDLTIRQ
jgi:hypothetical protein